MPAISPLEILHDTGKKVAAQAKAVAMKLGL
jgi:hypothetical protein